MQYCEGVSGGVKTVEIGRFKNRVQFWDSSGDFAPPAMSSKWIVVTARRTRSTYNPKIKD